MGQPLATMCRRTAGTSRIATGLVAIAATCLAVAALLAPLASAETFGQIGSPWGSFGTDKAQFRNPAMLGVDPVDGSVYAGDVTGDNANYRIQKLTSAGVFKASALISRFDEPEKIVALHGIAVDHAKERFYVIDGCRVTAGSGTCKKTGTLFSARRILVYKTAPEGETLVPAGAPFSLPTGAEELYTPQSIAVDPSNNDILVMPEDSAKHIVIQRISSTGTLGARYVDATNVLKPAAGREATSIAVAPSGVTYTLTGAPGSAGAKFTRAWELPSDLSSAKEVPGFATSAETEDWFFGLQSQKSPSLLGGPQVAISPDGGTLYWKESQTASSESEAGSVLVRGYSLSTKKTTIVYGGSLGSTCKITTSQAGIATSGNRLIVFDYGPSVEGEKTPVYGDNVITFGPGGSGCPIPTAKFTVNGFEQAEVNVEQGASVSFNASGSELFEGFRRELIWKFGDGSEGKVTSTIDENEVEVEAAPTISHTYASAGKFTVSLEIKLKGAPIANVGPVEHVVNVQGGVPSFLLKTKKTGAGTGTVTSAPGGINCGSGTGCEGLFPEGSSVTLTGAPDAGSKAAVWTGCGEVTGENKCKVTISAAKEVTAKFDLEQHLLKVKKEGSGAGTVTSAPAGINCGSGAGCEASYDHGTLVTLTGAPDAGSKAVAWTGCDEVTGGSCKVTISAAKEVTAKFDLEQHLLKVVPSGSGSGAVTSSPAGINCGVTCEANYDHGAVVLLTGAAGTGSKAVQWMTGCDEVTGENKCKVTMGGAKEVTAKFDLEPGHLLLTVKRTGTGTGTVTSAPIGVNCGSECEAAFVEDEIVLLSAAAGANSKAVVWTGCDEVTGENKCKVTISAAKEVIAKFDLEQHLLKVVKAGSGTGTVTSTPAGIDCGSTCQSSYDHGAVVTLKGVSGVETKAVQWGGCDSVVGANECKVTLNAAKEVTATFDSNPPTPPSGGGGSTPPSNPPPPPPPVETKPKLTPKQKALAKCKKLKGKAKAKCVKKANSTGKPKKHRRSRG